MIETKKKHNLHRSFNWLEEGPQDAQVEVLGKSKCYSNLVSKRGCTTCPNEYPLTFKDIPSFREYKISGMCQKCQDEVFRK